MGDPPGFLTTNPYHTYKHVSTVLAVEPFPPPTNKNQLTVIVAGLKLNKRKNILIIIYLVNNNILL